MFLGPHTSLALSATELIEEVYRRSQELSKSEQRWQAQAQAVLAAEDHVRTSATHAHQAHLGVSEATHRRAYRARSEFAEQLEASAQRLLGRGDQLQAVTIARLRDNLDWQDRVLEIEKELEIEDRAISEKVWVESKRPS